LGYAGESYSSLTFSINHSIMKIKYLLLISLIVNLMLSFLMFNHSFYKNINFSSVNVYGYEKFRQTLSMEYYRGGGSHFQLAWWADANELPENSKIMFRPIFLDEDLSPLYVWLATFLWDVAEVGSRETKPDGNPVGLWTHDGRFHAVYANIRSLADYKFDFRGDYFILFQAVIFTEGRSGYEIYDVSRLFAVDDYVISPVDHVDLSKIVTIPPERPDG